MGFGTVFSTLAFLLIFSGMVVLVVTTQHTLTASATEIRQQQEKLQEQTRADITIIDTEAQGPTPLPWTTRYQDEFATGSFDDTRMSGDRLVLDGATIGTYTSQAYNTGHESNYTAITWTAVIPSGASLSFQVRSADTEQDLETAQFTGPDGTTSTSYTTSGAAIHAIHQERQYIQWRATLETTTNTPELIQTTIGVQRNTPHVRLEVQNTGQTKLRFEETDGYINGQRITRTDADRIIEYQPFMDARLWNPTQAINYTTFTPGTITLQNNRAQTTTTI